ncbi:iron-sulfur cluster assembly protein [Horticoccus luteus]|uniref:Iron-sulfur cluster assembly protein n=1 Tax=Horticoccus luteus TaxID=2862869 RepID=A0A8F9TSW1_9BACT|nr:iron-sulfur cluster assembly protein [Horticoccus luteus]QYM77683.1 iron-sulfur cluster assembly protein [Horticoccus luteus]
MDSTTYRLNRDCSATRIPAGDAITLAAGSEVSVMQTLGGNITVRIDAGLARIAREDVSAIEGFELPSETPVEGSGEFSETAVWEALKTCFDPEIPVNIVDLGLVYDLAIEPVAGGRHVDVKMTLTAPGCGMGPVIAEDARQKIAALPTVVTAKVHIVWDPIWTPHMISAAGREKLGLPPQ